MTQPILLGNFRGFAVRYDEQQTPWFRIGVEEALKKISSVTLGKELLKLIADANPHSRVGTDGVAFGTGINVIVFPQDNRSFMQSGFKPAFLPNDYSGRKDGMQATPQAAFNNPGHRFTYVGTGSCNANADTMSGSDGKGTVCEMAFDSAQMMTRSGESTNPALVLAHELIHSYHGLYGINKGDKEEHWTTGIGQFKNERMSENAFRALFRMKLRTSY
ncbi:MAG: hypothetical protein JRG76_09465 [Deltaproteobacteria bacterium]|nr:hypothetical protein [Deltaproteobacteria bacterium]